MNTLQNLEVIFRSCLREMADQDFITHDDYLSISDLLERLRHKHFKKQLEDL